MENIAHVSITADAAHLVAGQFVDRNSNTARMKKESE